MKWQLVPVEPTDEMVIHGAEQLHDCGIAASTEIQQYIVESAFRAMLETAPQPPKLSDERILELWASNSGRPVTMGKARIIAQARAIEREILGGGHE